jgi:hypothetical protein
VTTSPAGGSHASYVRLLRAAGAVLAVLVFVLAAYLIVRALLRVAPVTMADCRVAGGGAGQSGYGVAQAA